MAESRPIVFLVCPGLGNITRGFESFADECFNALKGNSSFDLYLLKGGGKSEDKEFVVMNLPRNTWCAGTMGKLLRKDGYFVEQLSFCIGLLPFIIRKRPGQIGRASCRERV